MTYNYDICRDFGSGFLRGTHQEAVTDIKTEDMEHVIGEQDTKEEHNQPAGLSDSQITSFIVSKLV